MLLVRITDRCHGQCTHCLGAHSEVGEDMKEGVFTHVLSFAKAFSPAPLIMLSGGEPTLHPNLMSFLTLAGTSGFQVMVLSNGQGDLLPVANHPAVMGVQVTCDPRFYPHKVSVPDHPKVMVETQIRRLSPLGRASGRIVSDHPAMRGKGPECFNLRSVARAMPGLKETLAFLRGRGFFCTPSINVDGTVVAGESRLCQALGPVTDPGKVWESLKALKPCNKCGMWG